MSLNKTQESYRTTFKNIAHMEASLGKELGLTDWFLMDQETIATFAKTTQDEQWIHLDKERCEKDSPYKKPIAHGFLMLSMCTKMIYDAYEIQNTSMIINYGLDKVRFPNATPAGTKFRGRVSLLEYATIPDGIKYKLSVIIELEGHEKPACVAEFIALTYH
jgi:acyl dehydratase